MFLVVRRRSGPRWDPSKPLEEQSEWPEHASFMDELVDTGFVVLGGPLADEHRVVEVVKAESGAAGRRGRGGGEALGGAAVGGAGRGGRWVRGRCGGVLRARGGRPVLVGRSYGGRLVELLRGRGLGHAGVAMSPAPPKGILAL